MKFSMGEKGFYTEFPYGRLDVSGDVSEGFTPYQLLIASIAVCSGIVLRKVLEKMRISFNDISIDVEVERNEEPPRKIERVHLHFTIVGQEIDERKIRKALALVEKNCTIAQSIHGAIEIETTYEIKEAI